MTQFRDVGNPYPKCPYTECNYYIDEESILKLLKDPAEIDFYHRLALHSFVNLHPLMRWCPGTNCKNVVKVKIAPREPVTCDCGTTFCFNCSQEWHEPLTCQLLTKWNKKYSGEGETMKWVGYVLIIDRLLYIFYFSVNTKDCPTCNVRYYSLFISIN